MNSCQCSKSNIVSDDLKATENNWSYNDKREICIDIRKGTGNVIVDGPKK